MGNFVKKLRKIVCVICPIHYIYIYKYIYIYIHLMGVEWEIFCGKVEKN